MNNKIRVIIADDEPLAREAISLRLARLENYEIIAQADNGEDALLLVNTLMPDVVFLDINMPKLSGLEAAATLKQYSQAHVVFISAYEEFALQAFRHNALDYITKPIDDQEFSEVLAKIKQRMAESYSENSKGEAAIDELQHPHYLKRMSLKEGDELVLVETGQIQSITSVKDYLCIKVAGKTYIQRQTMSQMESLLDPTRFLRIHRSHIVNLEYVNGMIQKDKGDFLQCADELIPVSRRHKKSVKAVLQSIG